MATDVVNGKKNELNPAPWKDALEPGMLRVFRFYAWLQLASKAIIPVHLMRERVIFVSARSTELIGPTQQIAVRLMPPDLLFPSLTVVVHMAALFALLYWSWLQNKLGKLTIPIALFITTIGLILEQHLFLRQGLFWQMFPFLTVVVILIAWQYGFRQVVAFTVSTTLLQVLLQVFYAAPFVGPIPDTDRQRIPVFGFLFSLMITSLLLGYIVSQLAAAQRKQRRTLAEANQKLVSHAETLEQLAVSRERMRLSRELHDTLAHTLSAMAVQIEALQTVAEGMQPKARAILGQIQVETHSGLDETRRALAALRASPLEDLGLPGALSMLARDIASRNNLSLDLQTPEAVDDLPLEVEQAFYRVAQEALTNAGRHARASRLVVHLSRSNSNLTLTIQDDGEGFSANQFSEADRFGLQGMRERADMIHAELTIHSQPGEGTSVEMTWRDAHDRR